MISKPRVIEVSLVAVISLSVALGLVIDAKVPMERQSLFFTVLGILAGAFVTLLFSALLEVVRKPALRMKPLDPIPNAVTKDDGTYRMTTLRVEVTNENPPWLYRWIGRSPALQCYGKITFYDVTAGTPRRDGDPMTARWPGLQEPSPLLGFQCQYVEQGFRIDRSRGLIIYDPPRYDPRGLEPQQRVDISSGQRRDLDVVCRIEGEDNCFGWSNAFYQPDWLTQIGKGRWSLTAKRYVVRITILSSAEPTTCFFHLHNDGQEFRLKEARCPIELMSEGD
jgi:hypothetical protein